MQSAIRKNSKSRFAPETPKVVSKWYESLSSRKEFPPLRPIERKQHINALKDGRIDAVALALVRMHRPKERSILKQLIVYSTRWSEEQEKFWIAIKEVVESNKRFVSAHQKGTLYVLVLDRIAELGEQCISLPRLKKLSRANTAKKAKKMKRAISDLRDELQDLGVQWSIWDIFEMDPSLRPKLPASTASRIIQPKLLRLPDIKVFLDLLQKKLDENIQPTLALPQPNSELADQHFFVFELTQYFKEIFNTPIYPAVAAVARMIFGADGLSEASVRKWVSRRKTR